MTVRHRIFRHGIFYSVISKIIIFMCLTSLAALSFFCVIRAKGARYVVVTVGKIACNTFCPAKFYEKPLYYYDVNTHPAVIVFGNIFPIVRFMAVRTVETSADASNVNVAVPGEISYMEYVSTENMENDGSTAGDDNTDDIYKDSTNPDSGDYGEDAINENNNGSDTKDIVQDENSDKTDENHGDSAANEDNSSIVENGGYGIPAGSIPAVSAFAPYSYDRLINFDFVHDNFYVIPAHTALSSDLLKPKEFLETDLSVNGKKPCILLYHTHSQEAFADSTGCDMSIVQVGDYLEQLLEERYGFEVIHLTTEFDMLGGSLDRSKAYTYAEQQLTQIVTEHPEIDMVIDLHRDGVNDNLHFVTDINGKPTAKVMLFNGISYSNNQGNIDYLYNPYLKENLALTYQMYLLGKTYYPDFFRCIYIEAYRYNLHLCKRSMLIEAGAQTNSFEEVKNAMEPLSELLARELYGEKVVK